MANAQSFHVFVIRLNIFRGERLTADTLLVRALDDLVIHVSEVLDEFNPVAGGLKISADHIEDERAARMADMAIVVDRHATNIHPNGIRLQRAKRFFLTCERVIDRKHGQITTPEWYDASANGTRKNSPERAPGRDRSRCRTGENNPADVPTALPFSHQCRLEDNTRAVHRERSRARTDRCSYRQCRPAMR